jgi:hypothetical protein
VGSVHAWTTFADCDDRYSHWSSVGYLWCVQSYGGIVSISCFVNTSSLIDMPYSSWRLNQDCLVQANYWWSCSNTRCCWRAAEGLRLDSIPNL